MVRFMAVFAACVLAGAAQDRSDEPVLERNPFTSAADRARGKQIFLAQCAPCHGPDGNGGRGANLARPRLPRASTDSALFRIIRDGIPGTEMPGAWVLIDREIWQVAAYVQTLGQRAAERISGNARRG